MKMNIVETIGVKNFDAKFLTLKTKKLSHENRVFKIGTREMNFKNSKLQNSSFINIL